MSDLSIVETAFDDKDEAKDCAKALVAKKLAACCQLGGPVISTYEWEGHIANEEEWCLRIKTTAGLVDQVIDYIQSVHSYEVPEVISYQIDKASAAYQQWVKNLL